MHKTHAQRHTHTRSHPKVCRSVPPAPSLVLGTCWTAAERMNESSVPSTGAGGPEGDRDCILTQDQGLAVRTNTISTRQNLSVLQEDPWKGAWGQETVRMRGSTVINTPTGHLGLW